MSTYGGRNKKETFKASWYDWSSLVKSNINNQYTITVRNKFDTIQGLSERHTERQLTEINFRRIKSVHYKSKN